MIIHLGQWNFNFADGSRLAIARSAGSLGVEITYLINAFLYSKKYYGGNFRWKTVLKMFLGIIPVYWLGLLIYGISTYIAQGDLGETIPNVLSHFFFLNGIYCPWWKGYMGGSGYFGVLALMWVVFPMFLKKIENLRDSILFGIATIGVCYLSTKALQIINTVIVFDTTESFGDFMWYINRGVYCFMLGNILQHVIKWKSFELRIFKERVAISIFTLMILGRMIAQGDGFDGLLFTILICALIFLNYENSIVMIDNPIWAFLGKNITELFVAHVVLYYVLVQNQAILSAGGKTFAILFCLSIAIAPMLKCCISKPGSKFFIKLFNL